MNRKILPLFLLSLFLIALLSFIPPPGKGKVNWITVNQLSQLYAKEPRPILIDVYTSWCGWCKVMDKKTYTNEKLASYINDRFYAVKFDAESVEKMTFNNKLYNYDAKNRINELADYLLSGRLEFPTTVFLSAPNGTPAPLSGYLNPSEMEAPLKFYGEKAYANQTFVDFSKNLKKEWK